MTINIKIMLFAGNQFISLGGWEDFQGFFDSIEEVKEFLNKNILSWEWAHIVQDGKITLKASNDWDFNCLTGKESKTPWKYESND